MYSVVLMMAMTTGGETPDLGHRHSGGSCCGAVQASCGCTGGGRHHRERHHRHGGGGCQGGGGCTGYAAPACGCTGGYTPIYTGCTGGYGGYPGPGCTGGHPGGIYDGHMGKPGEELKKMPKEEGKKTGMVPAPATLIVSLPADAKLVIDDTTTTSTSSERTFVSPTLNPGQDYNYTLKAEMVRNGKTVQVEEKVIVRAGEETRVTLLSTSVAAR